MLIAILLLLALLAIAAAFIARSPLVRAVLLQFDLLARTRVPDLD